MTVEPHLLTGAYAVDAVSDAEAAAFERHLAGCPECGQEVRELRETAARLAMAVAVVPPPELREATLALVAKTRQWPPLVATIRRATSIRSLSARSLSVRSLPARITLVAAAAAVVAAVVIGLGTWTEQRADPAQQQLAAVNAVLTAPDAAAKKAQDGAAPGTASVVTSRSHGKIVVLAGNLPPLAGGRVYQVWLIGADGVHSAGLVQADGPHRTLPVLADLTPGIDRVGITAEPPGGSPSPTTPAVAMIFLD